ncbi:MAG: hypothetical protein KF773_21995 [Deltaproteobacteria bacterium]|nr:hypothetical protein [Deltaproteobacteria bacterium]MCW5807291.1 hypothetical protein [Deltaproteobacteria bacterium]
MKRALPVFALLAAVAATASAGPYEDQLAAELKDLKAALARRCPDRAAEAAKLTAPRLDDDRRAALARATELARFERCAAAEPLLHQTLGAEWARAEDFAQSEASFRKLLALGVTEAAQIGLITALSRQPRLTAAQQADLTKHLRYFHANPCGRGDLCTGLAYAAFHLDDLPLARIAADRAIALKFEHWVPYFVGGIAYAVPPADDRAKARRLLIEAKKRGAPAAEVDGFLTKL